MTTAQDEFLLQFSADREDLVGARWWNASVHVPQRLSRRDLAKIGAVLGIVLVGAGLGIAELFEDDDPGAESVAEALELQRRQGWDVGSGPAQILLTGATPFDVEGGQSWKEHLATLARALEPPLRLRPFYVSTLFDSLSQPSLKDRMLPVHSTTADVTYRRALALAELLADGDSSDLGVILDLPGEDAVAAAAALSERFWPVFGFGNWPHPRGVVPSHLTLGAALYYLPRFRASAGRLSTERPPVFVLDSNRLNPYGDDPERFDNRYLAQLPSADNLRSLGVKRLMYVRPQGASTTELDDLNDEFVAFEEGGLEVRFVSLGDFNVDPSTGTRSYFWGGSPATHILFWPSYGRRFPVPGGPGGQVALPSPASRVPLPPNNALGRPARFEPRPSIECRPARRDTMFSSRTVGGVTGVGKQKPSGFGMVSVRRDPVTGAPRPIDRSGSFNRSSRSYSG